VNKDGEIIHLVRRKKVGEEVELLDLPAHGACTMFRKELLMQIGGYIEEFTCQDGYELWLRYIQKFSPYNINVPLFYYRQHPASLTKKEKNILDTRRAIKEKFVKTNYADDIPKVLGIIPVTRHSVYSQSDPFIELAGKPLLWYTLQELESAKLLDRIIISSEDDEVLDYAKQFTKIEPLKRSSKFSHSALKMEELMDEILIEMETSEGYEPDAICTLYISTPLRRGYHIDKAINTMVIFDVDSVISVQEELSHVYHHRKYGLEPINSSVSGMRIERKGVYKENSVIYLTKSNVIKDKSFLGNKIGHIVMLPDESIKITSEYDLWLCEKIITERRTKTLTENN